MKKGYKMSEETKKKMRASHLGKKYKKMSDKGRKNISKAHKGKRPWNKGLSLPQFYGENNGNWKGGRHLHTNGYIVLRKLNHPFCNKRGYVYEHRIIAEQKLLRYLLPEESVHHIDGNKQNNNPKNLMVFSSESEHQKFEARQKRGGTSYGNCFK